MKLVLLSVGFVSAAILTKPTPQPAPQPAPQAGNQIGSKQIADSKSSKIADFLSSMQNRVGRAESRAAIAKANGAPTTNSKTSKTSGNKLSRRQRKAARSAARKSARRDIVVRDPEAEEVFSGSASISFEASRRRTDHFSFSESEHFRDCSTTSSSSSGKSKKGCKKDKKKVGYRLRHVRVHAEESCARKNEFSASASASIDLGEADASGSLSASAEFKRSRTTVLRCCEDELSRRRKHSHRRSRRGSSDPYVRVDYRKKVYYNDDAEKRFSVSLSGSLSIEEEPAVTTVTEVIAKPTGAP